MDIYDVNKYTNIELYNILDLNQPTDRELEAKIHFFINKYENSKSNDGKKLYKFFNDIYAHLFDLQYNDDENDENNNQNNIQEGFDVSFTGFDSSYQKIFEPSGSILTPFDYQIKETQTNTQLNQIANVKTQDSSTIKTVEYIPGNLNPLLKQTIKRIISIDSQYRDRTTYPLTTFFTFNLSDTLTDVVSLKLYSVQIPYTWYTIDKSFGSNFFYLKGISPGINDGNNDYKFEIEPGNYTAITLIKEINKSIQTAKESYSIVDLSNTDISYNESTAKCTFHINAVQRYNDINYELYFPSWTNPGNNNEIAINSRFNSIPGFLGLLNNSLISQSSTYSTYTIYSNNNNTIPFDITNYYTIDSSNNYLNICFYTDITGNKTYSGITELPPTLKNITLNFETGVFTSDQIISAINTQFDNNKLLIGSNIDKDTYNKSYIYTSGHETINPIYRYKITIKLNKQNNKYYDGMKAVLQFPNERKIWLGSTSLFQFDNSINELNNIISEYDTPTTSFSVKNSPYIYLKCNKEYYGNNGITKYKIDNITPDNSSNPIYNSSINNPFDNSSLIQNTYNIIPSNTNDYYISKGNYTLYGDEMTIKNKSINITEGTTDIYGNNYTIYSSQNYTIFGNALINGNIIIPKSNNTTSITSNNSYNITSNCIVSGNNIIGNIHITGKTNVLNGNTKIITNNNNTTTITGNNYYISGNSFVNGTKYNGNICIIDGNIIISNIGPYSIYGNNNITQNNFSIIGNTVIIGSLTVTGNVNIYNLLNANITDINANTTITPTGNNYILTNSTFKISTDSSYNIIGQDTINGKLNSIYITGNAKIQGNSTINSPLNSFNIISGSNYLIDTILDGNIHINNNTNITNANINIYSNSPYTINGNEYFINGSSNITETLSIINGNINITNATNQCIISGNNYSIKGLATVSNSVLLNSGNLTVSSTNPYITKGNNYSISPSSNCIISGNTYIVNGNSIINGNNYSVYGNISVYQDNSYNDFIIDISDSSTYLLKDYLNAINLSAKNMVTTNIANGQMDLGSSITIDTNNPKLNSSLKFKIKKTLNSTNFKVDLSDCYLNTEMNFPKILELSNNIINTFTSTMDIQGSGYKIDNSNNIIKIILKGTSNKEVPAKIIKIENGTYPDIISLCNIINKAFTQSLNNINNINNINIIGIMSPTTNITTNKITVILNLSISATLDNTNYTAYLYDDDLIKTSIQDISVPKFYGYINNWDNSSNTWYNYLNIQNQNYNLNNSNIANEYSEISGNDTIQSNSITLNLSTNYFWIKPKYDKYGGVYTEIPNPTTTGLYNDILITLPVGTYSKELLQSYINEQFNANADISGSSISFITKNNLQYTCIRLNIHKNFTTKDFMLDFYDPVSFTTCNVGMSGQSSIQNVLWDATLGWILGFRNTTLYYLTPENQQYNITTNKYYYDQFPQTQYTYDNLNNATITGDTCVSTFLYNYFMIILDDYVQNHLNDGLVTITNSESSIPLPSYANRSTHKCDPITKKLIVTSTETNYNNLTAKQIYAANEILNIKQSEQSKYSSGPFIQDIFGLVPVKTSGMSPGQPYIEFGGSLQLQERTYFGPVNIRRMTIKLVNDKGSIVDLNGSNWSFSLICEQLYTSQNK